MVDTNAAWRTVCHGDIDRKLLARLLARRAKPTQFFWSLIDAAVNARRLEFLYAPQHVGTKESLKWVRSVFKIGTPPDHMPVSMIPHFLVFSGPHFLVLGEALIAGNTVLRQGCLRCVALFLERKIPRETKIGTLSPN